MFPQSSACNNSRERLPHAGHRSKHVKRTTFAPGGQCYCIPGRELLKVTSLTNGRTWLEPKILGYGVPLLAALPHCHASFQLLPVVLFLCGRPGRVRAVGGWMLPALLGSV